jgi:hypothetical protein
LGGNLFAWLLMLHVQVAAAGLGACKTRKNRKTINKFHKKAANFIKHVAHNHDLNKLII